MKREFKHNGVRYLIVNNGDTMDIGGRGAYKYDLIKEVKNPVWGRSTELRLVCKVRTIREGYEIIKNRLDEIY